jgi:hypothetical protein
MVLKQDYERDAVQAAKSVIGKLGKNLPVHGDF